MLEILLIVWIGKTFAKYAKKHNLTGWLWAIIGVLSYVFGEIIGAVILVFTNPAAADNILLLYVYSLPIAGVLTFISYTLMKSAANKAVPDSGSEVLDDDLLE